MTDLKKNAPHVVRLLVTWSNAVIVCLFIFL